MFSSDRHDIAFSNGFEIFSELASVGVVFVDLVKVKTELRSDLFLDACLEVF